MQLVECTPLQSTAYSTVNKAAKAANPQLSWQNTTAAVCQRQWFANSCHCSNEYNVLCSQPHSMCTARKEEVSKMKISYFKVIIDSQGEWTPAVWMIAGALMVLVTIVVENSCTFSNITCAVL